MEKMIELKDLLKHQLQDLYSAEEQIIEALPAMVENSQNPMLKKALGEHLKVTKKQKTRLDEAFKLLGMASEEEENKKKGFFSTLFGESGGAKCKGVEGLIEEGEKIMDEDMTPEVMDAAIIASAQKIEHYEISGYGTARAYARELQLRELTRLLETTLNEEYKADDLLTELAVGRINEEADAGSESNGSGNNRRSGHNGRSGASKTTSRSNGSNSKRKGTNGSSSSKTRTRKNVKSKSSKKSTGTKTSRSRSKSRSK